MAWAAAAGWAGSIGSRGIERATYEDLAFRYMVADEHPDHDTIADFRKGRLAAVPQLFVQVLRLRQQAGLVKLGRVAPDGTKVKANASKHKARSYERMGAAEKQLEVEVKALLEEAERVDAEEDRKYGKGKRRDEPRPFGSAWHHVGWVEGQRWGGEKHGLPPQVARHGSGQTSHPWGAQFQ